MNTDYLEQYRIQIAERLKKIRLIRGITQEGIAEMLNISDRQYRRYESGDTPLPLLTCYDLCLILRIEVNYLISGIHLLDQLIEHALRTMPEDKFKEHYSQMLALQEKLSSGENASLYPILSELVEFGNAHRYNPPIREFEGKFTIFTKFYERTNFDPLFADEKA